MRTRGWLCGALLCSLAMGLSAQMDKPGERLARLLSGKTQGAFQFEQTVQDVHQGFSKKQQGFLWIQKANRFRLEIERPKRRIVGDGRFIWDYEPDLKQVVRYVFDPKAHLPIFWLTQGAERFKEQFDVVFEKGPFCSLQGQPMSDCFLLRPFSKEGTSEGTAGVRQIRLLFNAQQEIQRLEVWDDWDQLMTYDFKSLPGPPKPDGWYRFVAPKGVDLIKN